MVNRWIEFVKDYASKNNISYTCAMCEIKTKNLYKTAEKSKPERKTKKIVEPLGKTIEREKEMKQMGLEDINVNKINKKVRKIIPKKKEEDNADVISHDLQQLIFTKGLDKIKKSLNNLNFRGRIETNPILRVRQILQNFNTIPKMKELIQELNTI